MKLVKILPDKIQIRTDDAEFVNARLNDLISVSDGEVELVTQICAITDNDVETQMDDNAIMEELKQPSLKVIECSVLGSVIDGEFKQQIDRYPSTDVKIHNISDFEFGAILAVDAVLKNSGAFQIAGYSGYDVPAYLDGNKFYQRHSCIVGNTGCGKSETVTKIIEETANNTNCNIVIFDIHGEYGGLSYVDNIRMGEVSFPIWMLGFADMVTNVLKVKEDSTVVMSALSKCYKEHCPSGNMNKPVRFSYDDIVERMERLNSETVIDGCFKNGEPKIKNGEYSGKLPGVINTMKAKRNDERYSFLFKKCHQAYLLDFQIGRASCRERV